MTLHVTAQALGALGICAALLVCTLYVTKSTAQRAKEGEPQAASPIYGIKVRCMSSDRDRVGLLLQCMSPVLMLWTAPSPARHERGNYA
jgi:hypothetical protein